MLPFLGLLGRDSREAQLEWRSTEKSLFIANPTYHAHFVAAVATAPGQKCRRSCQRMRKSDRDSPWLQLTFEASKQQALPDISAKGDALVRSPLILFFSLYSGVTAANLSIQQKGEVQKKEVKVEILLLARLDHKDLSTIMSLIHIQIWGEVLLPW